MANKKRDGAEGETVASRLGLGVLSVLLFPTSQPSSHPHRLLFITDELFPLIAAEWRVGPGDHALFGYSYGGLFAAYAALRRPSLITRVGAGSPGILSGSSKIFDLYRADFAGGVDHSGRRLHVTVCETELTVPGYYQAAIGAGTAEFLTLTGSKPLKGLTVTSRIIPLESHATGGPSSWADYLRTCLPGKPGQSPLAGP